MKKFLLIAIVLLLSLSFVACSGTVQYLDLSLWTPYEYEKLTYKIVEEGETDTGTLVMEMEELNADATYPIPQINAETKVIEEENVTLKKNYFILKRTLSFPVDANNGVYDVMENVTFTDDRFNPIYSYAMLDIAKERVAYTGTGDAPDCISYVTTSKYTYNADTSKWSATSSYLRQTEYGKTNKAEWFFKTQQFKDLTETSTDMNMLYYHLRFINNLTEDNEFKYQCSNPMVLESSTKLVNCKGVVEQFAIDESVPYLFTEYKNAYGDSFGGFSLNLVKITIFPSNQTVTGNGITVYYSSNPILAKEELSDATAETLNTVSQQKGSPRLPVIIIENARPSTTTSLYPDSRGTMTYRLTDITNEGRIVL